MSPKPDDLLTRDMLACALTERGFPVAISSLATMVTRGGGPPYRIFGRRPLYQWEDALAWAQNRLSRKVTNSSELERLKSA